MPSISSNTLKNSYNECLEKCSSVAKTGKNNDCIETCNIYKNNKKNHENKSKPKSDGTRMGYGTLRGLMRNL